MSFGEFHIWLSGQYISPKTGRPLSRNAAGDYISRLRTLAKFIEIDIQRIDANALGVMALALPDNHALVARVGAKGIGDMRVALRRYAEFRRQGAEAKAPPAELERTPRRRAIPFGLYQNIPNLGGLLDYRAFLDSRGLRVGQITSSPIPRSAPIYYLPEQLNGRVNSRTIRIQWFETRILALERVIGGGFVPYAFVSSNAIYSLDAACVEFLLDQQAIDITLREDGFIEAVQPTDILRARHPHSLITALVERASRRNRPFMEPSWAAPIDPWADLDLEDLRTDTRKRALAEQIIREGAADFRASIMNAWNNRCAISACDVVDALDAAHINPYCGAQSNDVCNGLALRADLHRLFDQHLLVLSYRANHLIVELHSRLRGTHYEQFHGTKLALPRDPRCRPHPRLILDRRSA